MLSSPSAREQARALILDAEREAQLVSAFARLFITFIATAIFLAAGGVRLPVAPIVLTYLASYAVVSLASAVFSQRRFFNPHLSLFFTAIDGISLALLMGFALRITGTPLAFHAAVPGFVFFFAILILATMRYTIGPILVAFTGFAGTWLIFSLISGNGAHAVVAIADPAFFFGPVQNAARWGFLAIAALLGLLAVIRRRRTLEAAIAAAQTTANLSRYLPEPVAEQVATQGIDALSQGQRQEATILFVDIRGFTALSERMTPEELTKLLSTFRSLNLTQVERHSGIVDKYIGDAVMAVFGVPDGRPDHAAQGLNCALAIRDAIADWNGEREGQEAIKASIGVHCGEVFAGAVGSVARMEFTVLGDAVNTAARLQERAKGTPSGLVISEDMLLRSGRMRNARQDWHRLPDNKIRGRTAEVSLLEYRPPASDRDS
ncbi:MAG: adenylate/guanylate cyclase domain-containing protein [Sulfitobacter sp.]|nr:adenylate/guanylate cyclase domain-containing protein [Sulfitobacter sp.]